MRVCCATSTRGWPLPGNGERVTHDPERPEQPTWPQYGAPMYGAPYQPPQPLAPMHPQATTALVLGIIGLAGTFICGVTVVLGPFAWATGARAKREIAAAPGQYRGEGEAQVGLILGIITTVLLVLAIVAVVLVVVLVVATADSVSNDHSSHQDALGAIASLAIP